MIRKKTQWALLATTLAFIGATTLEMRPCPITSVGKSYRMVCSGKTDTTNRFVLWDREDYGSPTKADISRCYFDNPCQTVDVSRHSVVNTPNGHTFESTLTILNVSHDDVGVSIHCGAMDVDINNPNDPSIISTCQVPVFSIAQTPTCRATPIGPDVQIDCHFPRVHPKLICKLGYDHVSFERESSIEYVEESLTPSSPLYNSIDCKGLLKVRNQTQVKYFVKVLPNFNRELSEEALDGHATVLEVNLPSSPKVVINMPRYIPMCQPHSANHTVTLQCSATTSSRNPTLHFYVGDAEISQAKSSEYKTGEMYSILKEYRITLDSTSQDKVVRCKIDETNYDTAVIRLATPPKYPPQFLSKEGSVIRHFVSMNESENVSARCYAPDGTPLVSNISVTCVSPDGARILRAGNVSNVVFFTIVGTETGHGASCNCTAYHVSGCYNTTAWLRVAHIGQEVAHAPSKGVHSHLLYVAAFFVGLIIIPIIVATCVFVYRHWDKLYTRPDPPAPSHYDYIDNTKRPKRKRRKSSHSESSMSVNSDYMSRYRDHIELHNLEIGDAGRTEHDDAPPPPCKVQGNNNHIKHDPPRAPSEPDSQYERHIPALPSRNKSASSYEESDSPPVRTNRSAYNNENSNRASRQGRMGARRPASPTARAGSYRHSQSSYDSSRRSVEVNPDDTTYVNPVTPFSSEESLPESQGSDDQRPWEEEALLEINDEEARRKEEAYLIKLLKHNGASFDEEEIP